MKVDETNPDDMLAYRCALRMLEDDYAVKAASISVNEVGAGFCKMSMFVTADMANHGGMCHGGHVYLLADAAFGYACNSHNQNAVSQFGSIQYLAPGPIGETIYATAIERSIVGRSAVCDVTVTTQDGSVIAEFRGHSRQIPGKLLNDNEGQGAGGEGPALGIDNRRE